MHTTLTSSYPLNPQNLETKSSWIKLLDFGNYPHAQGLQKVDKNACTCLIKTFYSLLNKFKRKFAGLPVYIGHPDDPFFAYQPGHCDKKIYAWVKGLKIDQTSLLIDIQWTEEGSKLIQNKAYQYLSPRWEMEVIGPQTFSPFKLISIGLTNRPNIPSQALCNEKNFNKTQFLSNSLSLRPSHLDTFSDLVKIHIQATGKDYTNAWSYMKKEYPDIYFNSFGTNNL